MRLIAASIRVPEDLYKMLKLRAIVSKRSLNAEVVYILEQHVGGSIASDMAAAMALQSIRFVDEPAPVGSGAGQHEEPAKP